MHGRVAFLPLVHIRLKALKPKETDFEPRNLGEHVRKRRLELRLTQKQVAHRLGVNPWTVLNWEKGHTDPPCDAMLRILRWLGYDPYPVPQTLAERMVAKRRAMGWSMKEAAHHVGVDAGTWAAWEAGTAIPKGRFRQLIAEIL